MVRDAGFEICRAPSTVAISGAKKIHRPLFCRPDFLSTLEERSPVLHRGRAPRPSHQQGASPPQRQKRIKSSCYIVAATGGTPGVKNLKKRLRPVSSDTSGKETGIMNELPRDILHCIGNTSLLALRNIVPEDLGSRILKWDAMSPFTGCRRLFPIRGLQLPVLCEIVENDVRQNASRYRYRDG